MEEGEKKGWILPALYVVVGLIDIISIAIIFFKNLGMEPIDMVGLIFFGITIVIGMGYILIGLTRYINNITLLSLIISFLDGCYILIINLPSVNQNIEKTLGLGGLVLYFIFPLVLFISFIILFIGVLVERHRRKKNQPISADSKF